MNLGAVAQIYPHRLADAFAAFCLLIAISIIAVLVILLSPRWDAKPDEVSTPI